MHFFRLFLAFVQKLCYYLLIFPKIRKKGGGIRGGWLKNCSKISKRGDDYSVLVSTTKAL